MPIPSVSLDCYYVILADVAVLHADYLTAIATLLPFSSLDRSEEH